jgi:hypothetical protein
MRINPANNSISTLNLLLLLWFRRLAQPINLRLDPLLAFGHSEKVDQFIERRTRRIVDYRHAQEIEELSVGNSNILSHLLQSTTSPFIVGEIKKAIQYAARS